MEKLASLLVSLGSGVLLVNGYAYLAVLGFIVAIYIMEGLMFE